MHPDRPFALLVDLERRLEALREEIRTADPPLVSDEDRLTTRAEARFVARQLRGVEKGITSAARSARDARRALAPPEAIEGEVRTGNEEDSSLELDNVRSASLKYQAPP